MEQEIAGVDEDAIECGAMLVRRRKCVVRIDSVRTVGRPVHVWQATEAAAVEQRQQAAGTP